MRNVRNAAADALRSVRWELHAPCKPDAIPLSTIKTGKAVLLNIPPRDEVPESPEEGWCGEVAIQEALLYHGAYFSQRVINAAGEPEHPDLYADEIPEALRSLRVTFDAWPGGEPRQDLAQFLRWVRRRIAAGTPVLVGLKIYPTAHPDWILDHFSLAVGAGDKTLSVNTAWGYREECSDEQLTSTDEGFSFKNDQNRYYAIAIERLKATADSTPVRLFSLSEAANEIHVLVKCEGLTPGQQYILERFAPNDQKNAVTITTFTAQGPVFAIYDRIDKTKPILYRCRASSRQDSQPKPP